MPSIAHICCFFQGLKFWNSYFFQLQKWYHNPPRLIASGGRRPLVESASQSRGQWTAQERREWSSLVSFGYTSIWHECAQGRFLQNYLAFSVYNKCRSNDFELKSHLVFLNLVSEVCAPSVARGLYQSIVWSCCPMAWTFMNPSVRITMSQWRKIKELDWFTRFKCWKICIASCGKIVCISITHTYLIEDVWLPV